MSATLAETGRVHLLRPSVGEFSQHARCSRERRASAACRLLPDVQVELA